MFHRITVILALLLATIAPAQAASLSLGATADHTTVPRGGQLTITMVVASPDGAHVELLKNDAYVPLSGGIDVGRCVWNGCVTGPGTAMMTETIQLADDAPLGPLTLTALASTADGSYVTTTVEITVVPSWRIYLPLLLR
jgi:hypothetical protein